MCFSRSHKDGGHSWLVLLLQSLRPAAERVTQIHLDVTENRQPPLIFVQQHRCKETANVSMQQLDNNIA